MISGPPAPRVRAVQDVKEIEAIWRGEVGRAIKSGRVVVLLVLFLLFTALILTVVGFLNHQANVQFDKAIADGANLDDAKAAVLQQKKSFLEFFTSDKSFVDSIAELPLVLLVTFKLATWFAPFFIALMGFDQLSGEVGPRSIRYLVVRVRRTSIVLGKLLAQATILVALLAIATLLMVVVARGLNSDFTWGLVFTWLFKLLAASTVLALAWLGLTSLCSALFRTPGISLVVNIIGIMLFAFISTFGGWFRFPGEVAKGALDTLVRSESWLALTRYASVWTFGQDLLHPDFSKFAVAVVMHVGFALMFIGTAQLVLRRRDL